MNYLDLFSGIGGFHLGLKWAGFKFDKVFYSDIEDYTNKDYAKNFPAAVPLGDVTKINPETLPKIEIITGGFPCQDMSIAGKQKGITGERSSLFNEIIRIVRVVRPKVFIMENVPNLLTGEDGSWMLEVLSAIASIGYDAEWQTISARDFGLPHERKRVFIVSYPIGSSLENVDFQKPLRINPEESCRRKYTRAVNAAIPADVYTRIRGNHNGVPEIMDRLKALGNAVAPQVVELIGRMILESKIICNF